MGKLDGKTAWITGAGTGIGLAGAQALAEAGATVVMSGRRAEVLEKEAAAIKKSGGRAETLSLDVSDANAVQQAAEAIAERHGRIDILVNSAGTNTRNRFWDDQSFEGWDRVIRINLDGTFYCTKAVLGFMKEQKDGLVINISSWAGIYNSSVVGPAYNGSKHAVVSITETLNLEECKNGIRACVICPGEVDTPIMEQRPVPPPPEIREKMLKDEDLGRTIRWVAEQPPHMCVNQIIVSPVLNRFYIGAGD
ncbi:MAG: SDR family oxidoreductase [Desulfobacteraceae bacterium]|nr:SDR family oxidoreductase [Desulfobacteraceae bacterium]